MLLNMVLHINYPPVENSFKITCNIAINVIFIIVNIKFTLYNRLDITELTLVLVFEVIIKFLKYLITMIT